MNQITLTAKEAAQYIGISYWAILELTKQKKIPFIAVGGRKLFRKETLDDWMAEKEKTSVKGEAKIQEDNYGKLRKVF